MPVMVVISGTGTDIGKTFVAQAVLRAARTAGLRVVGLKPVESGGGGDGVALSSVSMFHVKHPPYRFDEPLSPHLAARRRDTEIDLDRCVSWCTESAKDADLAVVELPGALLTPLSARATNADLIRALPHDRWVLVAPDRLGVLHETRASLLAAASHELAAPLVILNAPAHPDASTGTNAFELATLGICNVQAAFPRGLLDSPSVTSQAHQLLRSLGIGTGPGLA